MSLLPEIRSPAEDVPRPVQSPVPMHVIAASIGRRRRAAPTRALVSSRKLLVGLMALGLLPRLVLALAFLRYPIGMDDMLQYDMLARSLAAGHGYRWYQRQDVERMRPYLEAYFGVDLPIEQVPVEGFLTVHRPPGYALMLSALYALVGLEGRIASARLFQAFLGALLAPLAFVLAHKLGLSGKAASRAGVVVAAYPILWMYPLGLASENLFIPLVLIGVIFSLHALENVRLSTVVLAGLTLGAATLTRSVLAAFLPLAAYVFLRRLGSRKALAFVLSALLVTLPWAVRNSLVVGRPAFIENSLGYNLFIGYHPEGDGEFFSRAAVIPLRFLDDAERERWSMEQAVGFIRADPIRAAGLIVRRFGFLWGLEDRELTYFYSNNFFGPIAQPWLLLAYLVLVSPLIIVGASAPFGMAGTQRGRDLVLCLVLALQVAHVLILAEPRFHLPLVPYLAAYAAAAWSRKGVLASAWQGLRRLEPVWLLTLAAALCLILLWSWDVWRAWPTLMQLMAPGGNKLHMTY